MDIGRFVRVDDCTEDKARLNFAQVLITTPQIEIVNTTAEFFIDGIKYSLKMVEEWGCNLGEDAFLSEVITETQSEASTFNDVPGLDEVKGEWELDELVDDLSFTLLSFLLLLIAHQIAFFSTILLSWIQ